MAAALGKPGSVPVRSTVGSPPESPLGCFRGHCSRSQSRWGGEVGTVGCAPVLEHSSASHGVTFGLFRGCCPGKKPKSPGVWGVSWAQFGFVQPSKAAAVISWHWWKALPMVISRVCALCFGAGHAWWGSSASRKALKGFPKTKDLHSVCLPTPDMSAAGQHLLCSCFST